MNVLVLDQYNTLHVGATMSGTILCGKVAHMKWNLRDVVPSDASGCGPCQTAAGVTFRVGKTLSELEAQNESLTVEAVMETLMEQYDARFPNATPFARGHYEFEKRNTIQALFSAGFKVVW